MTGSPVRHNLITFKPANGELPRIFLDIDNVTRRGGLTPDVWCGVVPYTELAKIGLGDVSYEIAGTLEFWYSHAPGEEVFDEDTFSLVFAAPDVALVNVAIVDVEPAMRGFVPSSPTTYRAIDYRVSIADHRRAWVAPRGALLFDGLLNPDPLPAGVTLLTNEELMLKCSAAMGVTMTVPNSVNDAEPMRNVRWVGKHAPTALQELLEHTGHVYAPLISGDAQVVKPGTAGAPTIPPDRLANVVTAKSIDRRATRVVFTSLPSAEIHSYTSAASPAPAWKYVAQDPTTGEWKTFNTHSVTLDAAAWKAGLPGVDPRIAEQVYRCIQLDKTKYPPGKVQLLPRYVAADLSETDVRLRVTDLLVAQPGGGYLPQTSTQWLVPERIVPEANVLIFEQPLLKAPTSANKRRGRLGRSSPAIAEADLKPWFSVEGWDATNGRIRCGVFGFTIAGVTAAPMAEAAAVDELTGYRPNTCIYHSPDLQVVKVDGTTSSNRSAMEDRAKTYARNAMGVTTPAQQDVEIVGFLQVEIDAAVSQVVYGRGEVGTLLTLNGWHCTARTAGGDE